jgi:TatD DNase family protein
MLIDSHAHLNFKDFKDEIPQVLARAKEAGVGCLINVGTGVAESRQVVAMAEEHPTIFAAIGVHPHDAAKMSDGDLAEIKALASHEKVVAIGEVGLDYYYEHSPKEIQQKRLRDFVRLAKEVKLPLVIHCRDAFDDCFKILDEEDGWRGGGVFHCFTGDLATATKIVKKGFYVSFSGIVTFKKSVELQKAAKNLPRDRYLIETDCPFLTPEPHRGKKNEPAYVRLVAKKLAELKNLSVTDVERISARNTKELFGLPIDLPDDSFKIAYRIRNSLYLNITNQCTLACVFCPKFDDWMVKGHFLQLDHEPSEEEILEAVGDPAPYQEIVFCGFGESTLRLDLLKSLAKKLKSEGVKIRLDTEGLANLVHGRNVLPELKGLIDAASISLNAPDAKTYAKVCPSKFGEAAYPAVKSFIIEAKKYIPDVTASVVGLPNMDLDLCRKIVEDELKVKFRIRPYDEVG